MIQSMTAFARAQHEGNWGTAICEIRSINHRYLELSVRLPDTLQALEVLVRESIRHHIKRGKIELHLRYQKDESATSEITLNTHLVEKLARANETIAQLLPNPAPVNTIEILKWPGILQVAELDLDSIQAELLTMLENGLLDLVAARAREGAELKELFLKRLEGMKAELAKVRSRMPEILKEQRERLLSRFKDAKVELDANRLEQEMVFLAQKVDVTEEMDRLDAHISEVRRVLKQGGLAGRRLDFLMQELNREANTLGSKSIDIDTTRASVELKVLIEQMREQVQNIE